MKKKYKMTREGKFYRIKALRSFNNADEGELGGLVEDSSNLSHDGDCWISYNAIVKNNSRIREDAKIAGFAVCDNSHVYGDATVYGKAIVDRCTICDNALISGDSRITGSNVYDSAQITGRTHINYATVFGNAVVYGDECVEIGEGMYLRFGRLNKTPTITDLLRCSLGVYPNAKGIVTLFKRVLDNLRSEHSWYFQYPESGIVECPDFDPRPEISCTKGLHFATNEFWELTTGFKVLVAEIHIDDIICVLEGKARVKRANIVGVHSL